MSKSFPDLKDASRSIRYVSLICMLCQFPAYRVLQSIYPDSEGKEGPILPTDEWVEKEVLKTRLGRLEVNKDCLVRRRRDVASRALTNIISRPWRRLSKQNLTLPFRRLSELFYLVNLHCHPRSHRSFHQHWIHHQRLVKASFIYLPFSSHRHSLRLTRHFDISLLLPQRNL
jgi:hypothetical protein